MVAVNWQEKTILLGECKWGTEAVGRSVVRELVKKTEKVIPGDDWQVTYALFSRAGFTDAAIKENVNALYIDLATMEADLHRSMNASWPTSDLPI